MGIVRMDKFEELEEEAYALGIRVRVVDFPAADMDATYVAIDKIKQIFLRRGCTSKERTCWMAEELGHHHTGQDRIMRYDCVDDWRSEARARRWAHMRLLSPDAIRTAAQNTDDIFEIADALNVSVEFLRESIDDFQSKGIWSLM
jgi:Zn-dependent peptidase ImmA (M78 family)